MILFFALLLDAALGEPEWLWNRLRHPAVIIGDLIAWADRQFNTGTKRRFKGALLCFALVTGGLTIGAIIQTLGTLAQVIVVAILLAQRSLCDHVAQVGDALRISLPSGRTAVARIVGRDTNDMNKPAVARAAIESAAENLSDGIIAPTFWFMIGGLPAMLAYKAVNTADSMIGYRTPRHQEFGWASARFDDLLNYVPARLTALLIPLSAGHWPKWSALSNDARQHRSPNAGWPESAMAQTLDIALAGPRAYHGSQQDFPWVHPSGARDIGPRHVDQSVRLLWRVWVILLILSLFFAG